MVRQIIAALLMYLWNTVVEYQKPVKYSSIETNNNHSFRFHKDNVVYVLEVKQLKVRRKPRFPFRSRTSYLYEVTQYVFKNGDFVDRITVRMPEFSSLLFRNTKIPHVLAVNAFLEFHKEG